MGSPSAPPQPLLPEVPRLDSLHTLSPQQGELIEKEGQRVDQSGYLSAGDHFDEIVGQHGCDRARCEVRV